MMDIILLANRMQDAGNNGGGPGASMPALAEMVLLLTKGAKLESVCREKCEPGPLNSFILWCGDTDADVRGDE
jgi:hypothetical protein